ncbi:MAG: exonuclease subunit SbcD [Chitinivibrionales bacterium]|nr:exonuclease subunit SbcD [Chitinivibrionales bacterium]
MKLIHTGDWHLGATLHGRSRIQEHQRFLTWLHRRVVQERIDVLLVAGDVFDTAAPDPATLALFRRFLESIVDSPCRLVAIVAGERDTPGVLGTPHELLSRPEVQVFSRMADNPADEVLVVGDPDGRAELVLCAVPFSHGRQPTAEAIQEHCAAVIDAAGRVRSGLSRSVPCIVMGHLQIDTASGTGPAPLPPVPATIFPPSVAYAALGHVHASQAFGEGECGYYCGSPVALSFAETGGPHGIVEVELDSGSRRVSRIPVPSQHELIQIRGTVDQTVQHIGRLVERNAHAWVEVIVRGELDTEQLRPQIQQMLAGSTLEVIRLSRELTEAPAESQLPVPPNQPLDAPLKRLLDAQNVTEKERRVLLETFSSIAETLSPDRRTHPQSEDQ